MVHTLNRYILRQLVLVTIFVTVTLTLAIWLTQSLRLIRLIVNNGVSFGTFLELTVLLLPVFMLIILPIALFLSVLNTYNRLLTDREMVVMRSTGLSNIGLARGALVLAVIISMIVLALSFYLVPQSYRKFRDLQHFVRNDFAAVAIQEGRFNSFGERFMIYVRARGKDGELRGILVQDNRKRTKQITMMAERGAIIAAAAGPRVLLFNGNRQEHDRESGRLSFLAFKRYSFELGDLYKVQDDRWMQPQERTLSQLFKIDPSSANDRYYKGKLIAEGHNRIVTPFYPIGMTLIALACLLYGEYNKRGQLKRIVLAIAGAGAVQGIAIGLTNVVAKVPILIPLMYVNAIAPIGIGLYFLLREKGARPVTMSADSGAQGA